MAKILRHVNLFCTVKKQTEIAEGIVLIEVSSFWHPLECFTFLHNKKILFGNKLRGFEIIVHSIIEDDSGQQNIEQAVVFATGEKLMIRP